MFDYEIVERKGRGHPDTIADATANHFLRKYVAYCLAEFEGVPRISVDKLVLAGGTSNLYFGHGEATSPIHCLLVGKAADRYGGQTIPIVEILSESLHEVIQDAFADGAAVALMEPRLEVYTNSGIGAEHPTWYYNPTCVDHLDKINSQLCANDTSVVFGHSSFTALEILVHRIESQLSSPSAQSHLGTGTDVKVLAHSAAGGKSLTVTAAVPLVANRVATEDSYREVLAEVEASIYGCISRSQFAESNVSLSLNTKDTEGKGYLTLAGSSLDKGDQGAVGRGNGFSGVISMMRPTSMESHAGKNPLRSGGRVYSYMAPSISNKLRQATGRSATVAIQAQNGCPLSEPPIQMAIDHVTGLATPLEPEFRVTQADVDEAIATSLDRNELMDDLVGRVEDRVSS